MPRKARSPRRERQAGVASDKDHDLALLRIAGAALPAVTLGDSDAVRDGQSIAFTGFPIGQVLGFRARTHRGIVAALPPVALPAANRPISSTRSAVGRLARPPITVFQLDATAYAGHSGSPSFDARPATVLGIVKHGSS